MKIFIVSLLALILTPFFFAYFQNAKFEKKLKPALLAEIEGVIGAHGISDAVYTMDKLDVSISGIVEDKDGVSEVKQAIDSLGGGAVRVKASEYNVQVYGDVNVKKEGREIALSGNVGDPDGLLNSLNSSEFIGLNRVVAANSLNHDTVYRDSSLLRNTKLAEWSASYLKLKGDRGYRINARDNTLKAYGQVTAKIKDGILNAAEGMNITMDSSAFEIVDPTPTKLALSNAGGVSAISGNAPNDFKSDELFKSDVIEVKTDDFTELHPSIATPAFSKWVASYFGSKGARGMNIMHDEVTLTGPGTAMLEKQWLAELGNMGLKPVSGLELYSSEYHYPGYQSESKLDDTAQRILLEAFALNQIFFDSGSSDVRVDQQEKIDALSAAISKAGDGVSFVIGGHADATGNAEFNRKLSKKRANSVVRALGAKGVSEQKFTVVSFGAAKAANTGGNESDRKVELRIK